MNWSSCNQQMWESIFYTERETWKTIDQMLMVMVFTVAN